MMLRTERSPGLPAAIPTLMPTTLVIAGAAIPYGLALGIRSATHAAFQTRPPGSFFKGGKFVVKLPPSPDRNFRICYGVAMQTHFPLCEEKASCIGGISNQWRGSAQKEVPRRIAKQRGEEHMNPKL
jgi:hypothetical protein